MLLMLVVACSLVPAAAFAATPERVLRVGYIGYKGFMAPNEQGVFEGYGVEYLDEIARYANVTYEYVPCTWANSLQMLKNHEIDLVCTAKFTTERNAIYDYSELNFGRVQGVLYTRPDNSELYYEDYENLEGSRIGFLDESLNIGLFEKFASRNGFSYEVLTYPSDEDMKSALLAGEVDAIATEQMVIHDDLRLIANFSSNLYYLMSYQDNDFMADIDYAMEIINSKQYDYEAQLYEKYYGKSAINTEVHFTREEREFIAACPTLKLGINTATRPMAYLNENGTFAGIDVEILQRISEISGLDFEWYELPGRQSAYGYDYFRENGIDLLGGVEVNEFNRGIPSLVLSNPFLSTQKSLAVRQGRYLDDTSAMKIAYVGGSGTLPFVIEQKFPQAELESYDTLGACLDAVMRGDADGTLYNQYVLERNLNRPQYSEINIVPSVSIDEQLSISPVDYTGVDDAKAAVDNNPLLMSVLNKSIDAITEEDVSHIVIANTIAQTQILSWGDYLYEFRIPLAVGSALMVCIFALLVALSVNRQRHLKKMTAKNEELAHAVAQASEASKSKSQFFARMSHEIRTPMNAIVGLTTLAQRAESQPAQVAEYLAKIQTSSKVLLSIINDVLDMSAIESNKLKVSHEEFDLTLLLNEIATVYYTQCKEKGIEFVMVTDITDETVVGDSLHLNQILMNLVSNAYKFTDRGGRLEIVVAQEDRNEDKVFIRFKVSDTGCGMSESMMQRLFQPFEQADAATSKMHGGSGLGLSIVKNLVDMMEGAIAVESAEGEGTTFTVELPFGATGKHSVIEPDRIGGMKALIVDDDKDARLYTSVVMDRIGLAFDVAETSIEAEGMIAEQLVRGKGYDICFIDWKMPGMDGIELTRSIRSRFGSDTLIIIVSAYDLSEVHDQAIEAGADMFVSKPLFQSTVYNALVRMTGGVLADSSPSVDEYDFTGNRVLLAGDNDFNTEIAVDLLELVNLEVDHAENGRTAYEMFTTAPPGTYAAILMDVQMPEVDGHEATRMIRHSDHPEAQTVPIIAMTANAFTEDVSRAYSCGMNGHIAKPIDTKLLYRAIDRAINR